MVKCSTEPYSSLKLGILVEAAWIVKEAACYIICQDGKNWKKNSAACRDSIGGLSTVLSEKRAVFLQRLKDTELDLYRFGKIETHHEQLAADIFRQLTSQHTRSQGPWPKVGYAKVYRRCGSGDPPMEMTQQLIEAHGGELAQEVYEGYEQIQDMEEGWKKAFSRVSQLIKPLLEDVTLSQVKAIPTSNLRFITIDDEDLPWKQKK